MEVKSCKVKDLDFDKKLWLNELGYYKEEVRLHNEKLEDVVTSSQDREIMRHVEHFQNQLIRHAEVIDELRHDVKAHENVIESYKGDQEANDDLIQGHDGLVQQMDRFRSIYKELKHKFHQFMNEKL